jgi:mRNA interferase RelE/StbE
MKPAYKVKFPTRRHGKDFEKSLLSIPHKNIRDKIMKGIEALSVNPRHEKNFKKLELPRNIYKFTAQFRLRVGDYRILYNVDDKNKVVWILRLRKRNERTY